MKRACSFILSICLLLGITVTAFASASAEAEIAVSATDACAVCLKGVTDNTGNYQEIRKVADQTEFSLSYSEPGQYEYELRQIKADGFEIYDDTVYRVFVTVLSENDVLTAVVTGAFKGTDEKPGEFRFFKPETRTPPEPDPKTGDNTDLPLWTELFCAGGVCVFLVLLIAQIRKRQEKKNKDIQS